MVVNKNFLIGGVLLTTGTYKTFSDYNKAPDEHKTRTLIRNLAVLGTATATVFAADSFLVKKINKKNFQYYALKITRSLFKNKFIKSVVSKFNNKKILKPARFQSVSAIISNCTKDMLVAASAAITGIFSGYATDKILDKCKFAENKNTPSKYQKQYDKITNSFNHVMNNRVVNKVANEKSKNIILTATRVFNAAGFFPNPFDSTGVIFNSYELAKEKNLKRFAEKTSVGIIVNTFLPTMFLTITNSIIKNKNLFIKLPSLALSFALGDFVTQKIIKKLIKEVPQDENKPATEKIML